MISRPTTSQLIMAVRRELLDVVAPHVEDPTAAVSVQMSAMLLASAAVRADMEIGWMHEEISEARDVARTLLSSTPGRGDLAELLEELERDVVEAGDVRVQYERASELLSRAVVIADECEDRVLMAQLEELLHRRLGRELGIIGGSLVTPGRD